MDAKRFPVTMGEYTTFHAMDRALYSVLAIDLWHDPYESVQVLALWLWMERLGFKNFILFFLSKHHSLVRKYAEEALTCLRCINDLQFVLPPGASGIPLTSRLLKDKVSLQYFHENRSTVAKEIQKIVAEVCVQALPDLIEDALRKHAAYDSWSKSYASFGGSGGEKSRFGRRAGAASTEDSTMFFTFSRGFPVSEAEVRDFFTGLYGNCIEAFHMQPVNPDEQALYARVVFCSPSPVNLILNGASKAKFTINGKHVWVRKFVAKYRNSP